MMASLNMKSPPRVLTDPILQPTGRLATSMHNSGDFVERVCEQ